MSSGFASIRDLGFGRGHVPQAARELVRVLFRGDVHGQVAPAAVDAEALACQEVLQLLGLASRRHVDLDEPVVGALALLRLFPPFERFALFLVAPGERDRRVFPLFLERMPARDRDVGAEVVGGDELACDQLRLVCPRLVAGIEEDVRAVTGDDDAVPQPFARLIVEIMRAKALAEAEAVRLVGEVDLHAPFVFLHGIG